MSIPVQMRRGFARLPGFAEKAPDARIGNDVVDLAAFAAQAPRDFRRYSERICTKRELAWLDRTFAGRSHSERVRAVSCLWAAKEAVFKAGYPRVACETPDRIAPAVHFVPRNIEILPDASLRRAPVTASDHRAAGLTVRFAHAGRWVHALCYSKAVAQPYFWIARIARVLGARDSYNANWHDESTAVRELVFARLENLCGLMPDRLAIRGGGASGLPPWLELRLRADGAPLRLPISLSHDGDWVAAAVPRIPPVH